MPRANAQHGNSCGSSIAPVRVRAVSRVGDLVLVMGMVGRDADGRVVPGVGPQTRRALERVEEALSGEELDRGAVARLRVYLTDIDDWPVARDEITAFLGEEWPPAVVVQVQALVEPSMKVEIEVEATA